MAIFFENVVFVQLGSVFFTRFQQVRSEFVGTVFGTRSAAAPARGMKTVCACLVAPAAYMTRPMPTSPKKTADSVVYDTPCIPRKTCAGCAVEHSRTCRDNRPQPLRGFTLDMRLHGEGLSTP